MAVSFPISLANIADVLDLELFGLNLQYNQQQQILASGDIFATEIAPPHWTGEARSRPFLNADADKLLARLHALDGSINAFYLYNARASYPYSDQNGTTLGASSVTITAIGGDNKSFSLSGLPANYVLTAGDKFNVTYQTSRVFMGEISFGGTADGSGVLSSVEVRPHFPTGVSTGAVNFAQPYMKAKIRPNSLRAEQDTGITSRIVFEFNSVPSA